MTFDPRWLNQLPLSSLKGGDANSVVSMTMGIGLDVSNWETDVSLKNIPGPVTGVLGLDSTMLKSGNIFVVYEDATNYKAAVLTPGGNAVSGISPVAFGAGGVAGDVIRLATLSNGNVVVAFSDSDSKVKYMIFDERLHVVKTSTVVSGTDGITSCRVTVLADGNFVISYADGSSKSAFQIFDIDGDLQRDETIISTSYYGRAEVVGLPNGNFMVGLAQGTNLYYAIYNRQGIRKLAPTSLGSTGSFAARPLTLLVDGHVVFNFGTGGNVYFIIVDSDGNIVKTSTAVDSTGTMAGGAGGLVSLPNGQFGVAFRDSTGAEVYFSIFSKSGNSTATSKMTLATGTAVTTLVPGIFNSGGLNFFFIDTTVKYISLRGASSRFNRGLSTGQELSVGTSLYVTTTATIQEQLDLGGLFLTGGDATVTAISNLSLSSNPAVLPTSNAVKAYVDSQVGNVPRYIIDEGDSKVEVQDSTSEATQYVTIQVNDTELGRFEDLGTAKIVRIGPSGDTRIDLNTNTDIVSVTSGSTEVLNLGTSSQVLGVAADTAISLDQSLNIISFKSANAAVGQFDANGLTLATGVAVNKFSNDATLGGYNGATGSDAIVASEKAVRGYIDGIHASTLEPTGVVSRSQSTMTFGVDGTNTFTITPASSYYDIFLQGKRYRKTVAASINITDVEGMHYIYFDASGVLSHTASFTQSLIYNWVYIAAIYWDATNKEAIYFGDERHSCIMDSSTHWNLHNSRGTVYIDGLGIGDLVADGTGSLNTEAEFSVSAGSIMDEDLTTNIPTKTVPAQIPMFYRSGTGAGVWRSTTPNNYPVTNAGSGRMAWNEKVGNLTWALTEAVEGYYVLTHIFATNDYDNSRKIIGIAGQTEYATLTAAKEASSTEINTLVLQGLPFAEFTAVGSLIFQTSSTYTNAPKASLRSVGGGSNYMDWRYSKISSVPGVVTDHGSLSGLGDDDHLQYARLSGLRPFTGLQSFNAGLTVAGGYLTLDNGVAVNDFSNDTALGGDSSASVPTEHAVKSYVDTAIANLNPDKIWANDSKVEVIDDGTHTGYVQIVTDGVQVAYFQTITQRLGAAADSRVVVDQSADSVNIYAANTEILAGGLTSQTLGIAGDTRLALSQAADTANLYVANTAIITGALTSQTFGVAGDTRIDLSQAADTANIYVANTAIITGALTTQTFGIASDSRLELSQASDTADLYAGTAHIITGGMTAQTFGIAGDSRLTVDQFNDTVDLYAGNISVLGATTNVLTLGKSGDTYVTLNQLDNLINTYTGNTLQMQVENTGVSVEGDLTVRGNLSIDGTAFVVFNEEVRTADNIITVNDGDPGPGVTRGIAGLEIDRGSSAVYQFIFDEDTDTFRVGETGQTQAVATREDDPDGYKVAWWNDTNRRFETLGQEYIKVDQTSNNILLVTGSALRGQFDSNGLTLQLGTSVNEFSTDNTLAGASNDAVPTEAAVKSYVDAQIGGQANLIFQGNSKVEVIDDGTASGTITVTADGVDVSAFQAASQRVGLATDSRLVLATGIADLYAGASHVITATATAQTLGISGDSRVVVDQSANTVNAYAGASLSVLSLGATSQTFGLAANSKLDLATGTANMFAGSAQFITGAATAQTFGLAGDTRLDLSQAADTANLYVANTAIVTGALTSQTFGIASDSRLDLNQTADTADLYAGTAQIIDGNLTSQTFGIASDSRLELSQSSDTADLYAGTAQIIDGNLTSQSFGSTASSRLFLDQTNSLADLYAGATQVLDTSPLVQVFGVAGDTLITLNQTANSIVLKANNATQATFDTTGVTLAYGTSVDEFSTDVTLGGNSDDAVPTEKAVKTYVDTEITDLRNELDLINVKVITTDSTAITGDVLLVDTTAANIFIELIEHVDGKIIVKKKTTDSNKVYVTTSPGTIDGQSQIVIDTAFQSYTFVCDGGNFFII